MMDVLNFIFSGFWHFIGAIIILGVTFEGIELIVKAFNKPKETKKD